MTGGLKNETGAGVEKAYDEIAGDPNNPPV